MWKGSSGFRPFDPQISFHCPPKPFPDTWSARWHGRLQVPTDGTYEFIVKSNGWAQLELNRKTLIEQSADNSSRGQIELTQGRYPITIKYRQTNMYADLQVAWKTPDGVTEIIPYWHLIPSTD